MSKREDLGEVLEGDRMSSTPYSVPFRVDRDNESLCHRTLGAKDLKRFRKAVKDDYNPSLYKKSMASELLSSTEASVRTARSVCVELSCGGTSPVEAVSARGFGDTAACVVFVEASAFSSRAIEASASGRSSCSRPSRLSGLRLCMVLPRE